MSKQFFNVISISREDLVDFVDEPEKLNDTQMERLARLVGSCLMEGEFWETVRQCCEGFDSGK